LARAFALDEMSSGSLAAAVAGHLGGVSGAAGIGGHAMTIRSAVLFAAFAAASVLSAGGAARAETLIFNCSPVLPPDGASMRVRIDSATGDMTYYPYERSPTRPDEPGSRSTASVSDEAVSWRGAPPLDHPTVHWVLNRRTGELTDTDDEKDGGRTVRDRLACKVVAADKPPTRPK
jgi:hypothetical protein